MNKVNGAGEGVGSQPEKAPMEQSSVKYLFRKIGPVQRAELELGELTIIAGRNNTGKTYLVYTLYGFLKMASQTTYHSLGIGDESLGQEEELEALAKKLLESGEVKRIVQDDTLKNDRASTAHTLARIFSRDVLASVFSSRRGAFEGASVQIQLGEGLPRLSGVHTKPLPSGGILSLGYDNNELSLSLDSLSKGRDIYDVLPHISQLYRQFLFPDIPSNIFILSAERFGISLFYRELDFTKNRLVDMLQNMRDNRGKSFVSPYLIIDRNTSRYALPIKDNIDYTRSVPDIQRDRSQLYESKIFDNIKDMMGGYYSSSGDDIRFISKRRKEQQFNIPLHLASSSARGLSDLYFFLRHEAQKNHLLIIDEPESHLDTANQIFLARLLARFVRVGLKVLVTTHSDYFVKEVNNLIMLNGLSEDRESVAKKLKYSVNDGLTPESVSAYIAEESSLRKCTVDLFGIDMPVFDTSIDQINAVSSELSSRLYQA